MSAPLPPCDHDGCSAGGCTLAGPGRGDCEHFVGLPGKSIPGQHDGQDDTVDVYGKPNGWCWQCWKSRQIEQLRAELVQAKEAWIKYAGLHENSEAACNENVKTIAQLLAENHVLKREIGFERAMLGGIRERLQQHRDNLALWKSGALRPTVEDDNEQRAVMHDLCVAITELETVLKQTAREALKGFEEGKP